jgi:hypothetical protein
VAERRRFEVQARRLIDEARRSADPERAIEQTLAHREQIAVSAEQWRESEEALLAELVSKLERKAEAERAAGRATAATDQLRRQRRQDELRVARNARRRERYRREGGPLRTDSRPHNRPIRVEVDPSAWAALKLEAVGRRRSMPRLLGELVRRDLALATGGPSDRARDEPRWHRTGEGRRARQYARIDVDDEMWKALRVVALAEGLTVARRLGIAVERCFSEGQFIDA